MFSKQSDWRGCCCFFHFQSVSFFLELIAHSNVIHLNIYHLLKDSICLLMNANWVAYIWLIKWAQIVARFNTFNCFSFARFHFHLQNRVHSFLSMYFFFFLVLYLCIQNDWFWSDFRFPFIEWPLIYRYICAVIWSLGNSISHSTINP